MKRVLWFVIGLILLVPVGLAVLQDSQPPLRMEVTGVNATGLPSVVVNANVYDRVGQPVLGLTEENFSVFGELVDRARIVRVENITDDSLSFSVVLAIDTSSSMAGTPIERAKEAAISFVNSIGPNDPVAIVTFDSTERLIQDYTTDKTVLVNAISSLGFGGQTALYDAGVLAVDTAARSPEPRRAVIILSDGAEFGGRSSSERGAALSRALAEGVPVYTVGLGFGFDRTYLQELSGGTNAQFRESPTPDELLEIYNTLARTLRSQYIITLETDLAPDGATYQLGLRATRGEEIAAVSASVRAPVLIPIVSIPDLPIAAISEPTIITAEVIADDGVAQAELLVNGVSMATFTEPPYSAVVDPVAFPPGPVDVTFTATDSNGDTGTVTEFIEIAALPSQVTIAGLPEGELRETTEVSVQVTGQTPPIQTNFLVDGEPLNIPVPGPFSILLDPYQLAPGERTLTAEVTNAGGVMTSVDAPFTVAALPPEGSVVLPAEPAQPYAEPVEIGIVTGRAQGGIRTIIARLNGTVLASAANRAETAFTIDPAALQPGTNTIEVVIRDVYGTETVLTQDIEIAALPPTVAFANLEVGETLSENRTVEVAASSVQTPITSVVYRLDGTEVLTQTEEPFSFDLDVEALGDGPHILSVEVTNAGGQSVTAETAFTVALPTPTPVPTNTPIPPTATPAPPTPTASATPVPVEATPTNTPGPTVETVNITNTTEPTVEVAVVASNTPVPAPATNTSVPASATPIPASATPIPASATPIPASATPIPASATPIPASATPIPASATRIPASATPVPPTATEVVAVNVEPTTEATPEATEAVTEEPTAEATPEATPEATVEATVEATAVPASATPEQTAEATAETTEQATLAPTFTPIPLTAETQAAAGQAQSPLLIGAICLLGLLLLAVIYWLAARRRK
ncbi:MAG: VWA domain-containing protein [Anaerolineae bacterium]|nr:VWA domain-containing protein [Anaerolineae bacterium]